MSLAEKSPKMLLLASVYLQCYHNPYIGQELPGSFSLMIRLNEAEAVLTPDI